LYKTVYENFGKIDVLISNAAVHILGPLADYTEEMFDKTSDANFKGTFFTVQRMLPYLNNGASIVLTSIIIQEFFCRVARQRDPCKYPYSLNARA
jgi:NAD(P)-dependent dehydrogenase (short-subunit alcohol dehydrogenase family)